MKMPEAFPVTMLAPCGMNCAVCYAFLRKKKPCMGCRGADADKPNHCRSCNLKDCAAEHGIDFCVDCADFPCATINRLDKRYRKRYHVSLIANALSFQAIGTEAFLRAEKMTWSCAQCDGVVSLHDRICSACEHAQPLDPDNPLA